MKCFLGLLTALLIYAPLTPFAQCVESDGAQAPIATQPSPSLETTTSPAVATRATDTSDPAAVADLYLTVFEDHPIPAHEWSGNVGNCQAGDVSSAYRNTTLKRVNFYREMVGLPPVAFDAALNPKCQEAALMMVAEGKLSHSPPNTWACYTADGALAASKSNLSLGIAGPQAASAYMNDSGNGNGAVGHRRWILYPPLQTIGSGSVISGSGRANSLWVISGGGSRPASPAFVPWPSKGYFPYQLLPSSKRWSFSVKGADFSGTTVTIKDGNNQNYSITMETLNNAGFGDRTIVFKPTNLPTTKPGSDITYTVTITNVVVGADTNSYTYNVIVMDPAGRRVPSANKAPTAAFSASPTSGTAPLDVSFDANASADPDGSIVSYAWDFGDGSAGTGNPASHTYTSAGTFTAKLTIKDNNGATSSTTSTITVSSSSSGDGSGTGTGGGDGSGTDTGNGGGGDGGNGGFTSNSETDSDGDNYPDELENALGSSSSNESDTPFAMPSGAAVEPLTTIKFIVKLNFSSTAKGKILIKGSLPIPEGLNIEGQTLVIDAGGVIKTFTLDSKGKATQGDDRLKLKVKSKKGVVLAQTASFMAKFSKATFRDQMADEGLLGDNTLKGASRVIPIIVLFNNKMYQANHSVLYKAKASKKGIAK